MAVITKQIKITTKAENDIIDITEQVADAISESKITNGTVTIFVSGSTGAITTIEYEPGLVKDFPDMLSRIVPSDINYEHEQMWHDGNGRSHVKASLVGPSLAVPFKNSCTNSGEYVSIILYYYDVFIRF